MASRGINKVILVGNLGKDPEVRYMTNGGAVTSVTLATSESWRDKQGGETREVTEWHRVVFFGKLAEIAGQYLRKGSQVYVEGQLKTRKWQDKSGQERFTTEVVVNVGGTLQMLGGRPGQVGQDSDNNNGWGQPPQPEEHQFSGSGQPTRPASQQPETPSFANNEPPMDFDDDIPF